jgi:hypothetical protein
MNRFQLQHGNMYVAAFALLASFACATNNVQAQTLRSVDLFSSNLRCDHVIQQMLRHGVNNSFDRCDISSIMVHDPFGSSGNPRCEMGDLEIMQVSLLPHADPACGPKFAVTVSNNSTRKVCDFHVSMVAIFGHITPTSPTTTVSVDGIEPGTALELHVQLPIDSLAMGNRNGQVLGYQRVVVAIDSFDELAETNEANNLKAYDVGQIPVVAAVVEQVEVGQAAAVSALETALAPAEANRAPVSSPAIQQQTAPEISVDSMDLQSPTAESLRSAIEQLGTVGESPTTNASGS